jgi:Zn-ribbon protein, possibly nucleic acid-binding
MKTVTSRATSSIKNYFKRKFYTMDLKKRTRVIALLVAAFAPSVCLGDDRDDVKKGFENIKESHNIWSMQKHADNLSPLVYKIIDSRDTLRGQVTRLEFERDRFKADIKKIEAERDRLKADVEKLKGGSGNLLEENKKLTSEAKALTDERDQFKSDRDKLLNGGNVLFEENKILSDKIARLQATLWIGTAIFVMVCFRKKIKTLFSQMLAGVKSRGAKSQQSPKPQKTPPASDVRHNPDKCPQCGSIRPTGQSKCPNPKCGIRF